MARESRWLSHRISSTGSAWGWRLSLSGAALNWAMRTTRTPASFRSRFTTLPCIRSWPCSTGRSFPVRAQRKLPAKRWPGWWISIGRASGFPIVVQRWRSRIRIVSGGSPHIVASQPPLSPWERLKIGAGTPPVLTRHGWLILYHGVSNLAEPDNATHQLCYSAG
jgi:hypothetical protein